MDEYFSEELKYAIKTIREWDNLTLFGKLTRKTRRPSGIDYRLVNTWLGANK